MAGLIFATTVNNFPRLTGRALRLLSGALMPKPTNRPLGGYSGVTVGTTSAILSVTPSLYGVQPFSGVLDVSTATDGPTPFAIDSAVTGAVTAADSNSPRVDLLYVRHDDPEENDGSTAPGAVVGYVAGAPGGGLPAVPQSPSGAVRGFPLARIDVPKLNNGNPTITLIAPFTVAAGGILPVKDFSAYPTNPYVGMSIRDLSFGGLLTWDGSNWAGDADMASLTTAAGFTGNGTVPPGVARNGRTGLIQGLISGPFPNNNNESNPILTVPAGFRPGARVRRSLSSGNSVNALIRGTLNTDGTITIAVGSTGPTPSDVDISALSGYLIKG